MDSARETINEGGGGTASVHNVLLGSGPVSITLWGRDMGLVRSDVPEAGWSARGLSKADNGEEGKTVEGQDLVKQGSR